MEEEKKEVKAPVVEKPATDAGAVVQANAAQGEGEGFRARPAGKFGNRQKRRPCAFCMNKTTIDYKDVNRLRKYMTQNGKIVSRRQTGLCARHQREVTNAIKRARNMSLI